MKLVSALVGLAILGGVALSTGAASAMPATIPGQASQASNVEQADYVCNGWGRCWHRPAYGDGYIHPHYYGGWGWHRGWAGWGGWHRGWGGWGGWHHGWGGWGWHRWHHWHNW
jgi:hypothetical protein